VSLKDKLNLSPHDLLSYVNNQDSLSLTTQADLLGISRSSIYYHPVEISNFDLNLMDQIDHIYLDCPFYGSRKMARQLRLNLNIAINRKKVQRLMRLMGIEAIYRKPNLSLNLQPHPVFPYLLKGLTINRPNQVWSTDITYIKIQGSFAYLSAMIDWHSRYVLAWELSNTLDTSFCLETARKATTNIIPEIINSDQGVQYTSNDWINFWQNTQSQISRDHKGRCFDNIFIERLWRSVKYEEIYLKSYSSLADAKENLNSYFNFYNNRRLHQALNYQTPATIYFS